MSATRLLLLIEHLPEREAKDRIPHLHEDVTEVRDLLVSKLSAIAARYHAGGWTDDPDGIQFSVRGRSITGTLELTRPD
jgi:hypothetical protein